ncbi:Ferric iron ABC transporter, ATP-binding protein [Salinisphaera dokdonensis CL-ES53]|uniref:Ferric iron ABC transporter, ATP-binding protein n=1 Tax=Salinisphaera dokdonensis CL-ES53 TaxID=1304272 RepID=A0ABV2B4G1_9GAMM
MLEIHNLCVHYGDATAVRDLSLTLGDGEILTLVGPTGCGKTSVLRTVAGLIQPAAGEIRIGKLRIDSKRNVPPEKRHVGLVFQDFALFPHLNVEDNIAFRLKDRAPAERWLKQLGLEQHRHAMPDTLSGGQKQRVALARALAHAPALLLLDEPLASLDAALKAQLRWEIRQALKAAGVPAIWVTHDQTEALSVGDRMGIMCDGRLEQIDEPDACFRKPASRFVAHFLGDAAFLPGELGSTHVHTALGDAPIGDVAHSPDTRVDVLVRPDDLSVTAANDGNGHIEWSRYEGETRLYGVRLNSGAQLRVRTNHEHQLDDGAAVDTRICAGHALALFEPERPTGSA